MNARRRAMNRRMAMVGAIIGGILLYLMPFSLSSSKLVTHHSLFFGSTDRWPSYMLSFGPLDFALTILFFWLAMRLTMGGLLTLDSLVARGPRGWIMIVIGLFLAFGAYGGAISTPLFGWYAGLESFVLVGAVLTALMGALALLLLTFWGACFGIAILARKLWQHVLQDKQFVRPFIWLGRYLSAEEVPETE